MSAKKKELSLYIHIPFCKRKCYYCDFCSFTEGDRSIEDRYVLRICEELKKSAESALGYCVSTIYFGGGTPSLLDASMIAKMLDAVRSDFELSSDAEITIECNPATAREGFFEEIRAEGVNRLSIGLQSADDCELSALGRLHNFAEFEKTYYDARRAGFDNISTAFGRNTLCSTASALFSGLARRSGISDPAGRFDIFHRRILTVRSVVLRLLSLRLRLLRLNRSKLVRLTVCRSGRN